MMENIVPHQSIISYDERCAQYQQAGEIVWFTGLSGAGKTTMAIELEKQLILKGKIVCVLDGDTLRHTINTDLDFSDSARRENVRRIGEIAIYLAKQAFIVLVSVISPYQHSRQSIRTKATTEHLKFTEVYVKASLDTCRVRDPKGLYNIKPKNFTGIDSSYEPPDCAEVVLDTEQQNLEICLSTLVTYLDP